jgi:DNA-binding FadR family transcriptional regulator
VIRWPNGEREVVNQVEADQLVVIREGSGIIKSRSSWGFARVLSTAEAQRARR